MTILTRETAVCQIDGTSFEYTALTSYSTYGCEMDGMPISMTVMPHRIPTCPTCHFPIWIDDLGEDDLRAVRDLVETPVYAAMAAEAPYAHYQYLLEELGRSEPIARTNNRLKACWQTATGTDRYVGYAHQLAEAFAMASDDIRARGLDDWAAFQTFVANVERQARLWADACARLDSLEAETELSPAVLARITRTRALISEKDRRRQSFESA